MFEKGREKLREERESVIRKWPTVLSLDKHIRTPLFRKNVKGPEYIRKQKKVEVQLKGKGGGEACLEKKKKKKPWKKRLSHSH